MAIRPISDIFLLTLPSRSKEKQMRLCHVCHVYFREVRLRMAVGGSSSWECHPAHVNTVNTAGAPRYCTAHQPGRGRHMHIQTKGKSTHESFKNNACIHPSLLPLSAGAVSLPHTPLGSYPGLRLLPGPRVRGSGGVCEAGGGEF